MNWSLASGCAASSAITLEMSSRTNTYRYIVNEINNQYKKVIIIKGIEKINTINIR